ncbi:MAG: hypothetical protein SFZ03_07635 [Candidatus Melainabacteria bacterium]|nr:hypothetical protein [Candidatus Melainabacteria bacterium]
MELKKHRWGQETMYSQLVLFSQLELQQGLPSRLMEKFSEMVQSAMGFIMQW